MEKTTWTEILLELIEEIENNKKIKSDSKNK